MKELQLRIQSILNFLLSILVSVAYAKCPDRQIGTTLKYNNQCLEFIRDQYYQPEALQQCQQYGGHLVTIESREKQAWLERVLTEEIMWVENSAVGTAVWLGISRYREQESDPWQWYYNNPRPLEHVDEYYIDENLLTYTNWDVDENEPDTHKLRDCAAFGYDTDFKWRAAVCETFPNEYLVICQYDGPTGFFSKPAVWVPVFVGIIAAIVISLLSMYYCHKRRKALKMQLPGSKADREAFNSDHEQPIKNTDNDFNRNNNLIQLDQNTQSMPPNHYGHVPSSMLPNSSSHHNFNIPSAHCRDKLLQKDLSLNITPDSAPYEQTREYNRSVSAPPTYQEAYSKASAPPSEENLAEEDVDIDGIKDTEPLRRPVSVESNNLSV